MKRLYFSLILLLACASSAFSAAGGSAKKSGKSSSEGYNITLHVTERDSMKNDTVCLAFYYNGKTYSKDTLVLNPKGIGTFKKNKPLDEGIYIIYFNLGIYFDILVGKDQDFTVSVPFNDINKYKIKGATEGEKFQELITFLGSMHKKQSDLRKKYNDKVIDSTTFSNESKKNNEEVESKQKELLSTTEGTFFNSFLKGTIPVDVPEFNEISNDTTKFWARYRYGRDHYFDNIDLSDPRMLRTPYFPSKVDNYMKQYGTRVDPDTTFKIAKNLIEKSKGNKETFQSMTSKMMNFGLQSNMMGMDKYWIQIADEYYFSGQATWADTSWVNDLRKEVKKHRYNQIGMKAQDLMMRDSTSEKIIKLSDLDAEIVLVYFYEPSCGHCRKTTPVIYDSIYPKYKKHGFEVFACYTQTDRDEWMKFVNDHKLKDWVNVWDPYRESFFWEYYDASSTPGVYLLNKERKFIAKKIDTKTLDEILKYELIEKKGKVDDTELDAQKSIKETNKDEVVKESDKKSRKKKK